MAVELVQVSEYVGASIAARLLGLTSRRVCQMCESRVFKTAHKPGSGTHARWRILRAEISVHQFNGHIVRPIKTKTAGR